MYDSIWIRCPKCKKVNEFQSKSGDCLLHNYNLTNCPDDVLENVNRHSPCNCKCGASYEVDINQRKAVLINNFKN